MSRPGSKDIIKLNVPIPMCTPLLKWIFSAHEFEFQLRCFIICSQALQLKY